MAQGVFDFQYEVEKTRGGMTGLAGLPQYLEFGYVMGLGAAISNRGETRFLYSASNKNAARAKKYALQGA